MTFTFVSNYINHHQIPVALRMYEELGEDYVFIQTEPMEAERVAMGWDNDTKFPFVHFYYEEPEYCDEKIFNSDLVMFGGVENEDFIRKRLLAGKPVIRYAERFYKEGRYKAISPRGLIKKYQDHTSFQKAPVYLLCSGAYVAGDYAIVRAYRGKRYTWGYFPEFVPYDVEKIRKKQKNTTSKPIELMWAGRMIDWKHPEMVIRLAATLKLQYEDSNIPDFHISMVGGGELEQNVKQLAEELKVADRITFTGFLEPKQVRAYMERAQIYLFTSDQMEGWGVVLNEAMNSGCCTVACEKIGAAPCLLFNQNNGILYKNRDQSGFEQAVITLLQSPKVRQEMAVCAYETIAGLWNPSVAAKRLLEFSRAVLSEYETIGNGGCFGELTTFAPPSEGPLSVAKLR